MFTRSHYSCSPSAAFCPPRLPGKRVLLSEDLSFPRLASLVADTIRSESDGPVTLVGHDDWGSVVVSLVLRDHPELVSRCVLLDVGAQPRFDTPALVARGLGILAYFTVNTAVLLLGLMRPLRAG